MTTSTRTIAGALVIAASLFASTVSADNHTETKKPENAASEAVMDPSLRKLAQENSNNENRGYERTKNVKEFKASRFERP